MATDLSAMTVMALSEGLAARRFSPVDVVEAHLARISALEPRLHAFVHVHETQARLAAEAADKAIRAGHGLGPLHGIPIAVKDLVEFQGHVTTAGCAVWRERVSQYSASLVQKLLAAGMIVLGKTHTVEFAYGAWGTNQHMGTPWNPWDMKTARTPGGSSSGSAVAVAARMAPCAIGTDTGGSVRVPAALCGVVGLRPTVGRVPGQGIAPISSTRDTAGPIARSVADCALLDRVLADGGEPLAPVALAGLRLGLARSPFWETLEPGVQAVADAALERLRAAGVQLVEVALPGLAELNGATGFPIALFEFVRDMGRYLREAGRGIDLRQLVDGIGSPDVAAIARPLLAGGAVPEAAYQEALLARGKLQALYADAFAAAGVQALLLPTTPLTAAPVGDDETVLFNGQRCPTFPTFIRNTDPGSNAGIPGVTLPAGLAAGLPVGLALDGPVGSDRGLLAIAAAIEAILPTEPSAPWLR
jgi:mandelamide amidase